MHAIELEGLTKDYGTGGASRSRSRYRRGRSRRFSGPQRRRKDHHHPSAAGHDPTHTRRGSNPRPRRSRPIGYLQARYRNLPGELPEFGRLRCSEIVGFYEGLRRVDARACVAALCERFEIDLSRRFKELSRGNKQKIGLLLAFMHEPTILVLDEPTAGLDPIMQQEFQRVIAEVRGHRSNCVSFLTRSLEVEETCDRAAIVRDGHLIDVLELDKLEQLRIRRVTMTFASPPDADLLRGIAGVGDVVTDGATLRCTVRGEFAPLVGALAGTSLVSLTSHEPSLEETFLDLYRVPSSK